MKLIYCGTDVYLSVFEYFLQNHEILSLFTYHNDEDYFSESQIVELAKKHNIPVSYEPVKESDLYDAFNNQGCDFLISCEYAHIIPVPLDLDSFKGINVHASYLPEGRGYYPIEAAFSKNLKSTGVTMHKIISKFDSGDIIYQEKIDLDIYNDSIDVYLMCSKIITREVKKLMLDFNSLWNKACPQIETSSYWSKPDMERLLINENLTIEEAITLKQKFNKMSVIIINNQEYYIRCMETSKLKIDKIIKVEDDLYLYPVKDGHLRVVVTKKED